jgi:hypothetical protein
MSGIVSSAQVEKEIKDFFKIVFLDELKADQKRTNEEIEELKKQYTKVVETISAQIDDSKRCVEKVYNLVQPPDSEDDISICEQLSKAQKEVKDILEISKQETTEQINKVQGLLNKIVEEQILQKGKSALLMRLIYSSIGLQILIIFAIALSYFIS